MILVDTSVWVEHFCGNDTPLDKLLGEAAIVLHPFVHGELVLHGLPKSGAIPAALDSLLPAPVASPDEVAAFIQWAKLAGTGVGYVDTHLLVSARMLPSGKLLTFDKCLRDQALRLEID